MSNQERASKVIISDSNSFSTDLVNFFFGNPYTSIGKKDLQEYIVYLLQKYAEYEASPENKKKFSEISDLELQSLFRVDKRTLRTIQNNVEIKYGKYEFTDEHLLEELMSLPKQNFKITKDGMVQLVIENGIVRNHLESKLRDICGTVFDYRNNPSMVTIEASLFIECLSTLLEKCNNNDYKDIKNNLSELTKENVRKKLIDFGKDSASVISSVGNAVSSSTTLFSLLKTLFGAT